MRSIVVAAVTAALVLASPGGPATSAAPDERVTPATDAPATGTPSSAERALTTVQGLLDSAARRGAASEPADLSLALRDLFVALPRLSTDDRRTAREILARPTDGARDRLGDGYTVPAKKRCAKHVCVHYVGSTADAPPGRAWVRNNLKTMSAVWNTEVGKLGYRRPASDKRRGGNKKLDVYLKELGSRGIYGYCTPERKVRGRKWLASGYCVVDNDFAEAQYGAPPRQSLRVTAAHEFFHAVQFAYDYAEDPWLMEASATWMEERFADDVNDNRQYLPYGQIGAPGQPLDRFNRQGFNQYGNWVFLEHLSTRFGNGIVRQIWSEAGAYPGSGHQYSTKAVRSVLAKRGGFVDAFRRYAAANTVPGRSYPEGGSWPVAPAAATWTLTRADRTGAAQPSIDHLASRNYVVRPGDGLGRKSTRLRIRIDGPARRTGPAAYLVVKRGTALNRAPIRLNRSGKGGTTIGFSSRKVDWAKVVLVNGSTRFSCWHRTLWSCQGRARDNNLRFGLTVKALTPKKRR